MHFCRVEKTIIRKYEKVDICFAGFMTETEKVLFSSIPANEFNTYWVPCTWFIYR